MPQGAQGLQRAMAGAGGRGIRSGWGVSCGAGALDTVLLWATAKATRYEHDSYRHEDSDRCVAAETTMLKGTQVMFPGCL